MSQRDAMDCGPTCLAMVSEYYGKHYNIEHLHQLSYITNEGVSLYGISIAAESIGFHTIGTQISLHDLRGNMQLPCIIHWNQNHFVVLYKIKKTRNNIWYYIADPAGGVTLKFNEWEFSKCFICSIDEAGIGVGSALYLVPTNDFFEKKGDVKVLSEKNRSLIFLFSYLDPYKKQISILFLTLILGSAIQLLLPFLTQAIVDDGIHNKDINLVLLILIGQLFLEFGSVITGFARSWILLKIGTNVNISLISDYLTKLMKLPISFFDTKLTGDIIQRINDHSRIQNFLTDSSLDTIFSMVSIFIFGIVIFIYNWIVSLMFFLGSAMYIGWVWMFMEHREKLDHKMFALNASNQNSVIQLVSGMQEIKLNACEQPKRWEWEHIQRNLYRLSLKGLKLSQYQQSGGMLINQVKNIVITAVVATFVISGNITLGMMLSIQYIVGMLNSPVDQLINFIRQYQNAQLSLLRLQDVYTKENEDDEKKIILQDSDCGDITLHNIKFSYDKLSIKPNIVNVDLVIPKGKTTAIVGLSGSGKTTLLKMILGFYCPDEGYIEIGNYNLENVNKREWRKKCGAVMQEGFIFSDTIAHNIAPDTTDVNMEKVKHAAQIANIADYIEELPLKYNTKIGNEGHGLSLGQKQRILIARAIYKNPDYIFLDEATNSLDANNEHQIMEHLNTFIKGKTAIVIAHRLSTVKNADNIVVIKDGKIAEQGRHSELVALNGIYYSLVKNQLNI